jgi:hypothetical protein
MARELVKINAEPEVTDDKQAMRRWQTVVTPMSRERVFHERVIEK